MYVCCLLDRCFFSMLFLFGLRSFHGNYQNLYRIVAVEEHTVVVSLHAYLRGYINVNQMQFSVDSKLNMLYFLLQCACIRTLTHHKLVNSASLGKISEMLRLYLKSLLRHR